MKIVPSLLYFWEGNKQSQISLICDHHKTTETHASMTPLVIMEYGHHIQNLSWSAMTEHDQ